MFGLAEARCFGTRGKGAELQSKRAEIELAVAAGAMIASHALLVVLTRGLDHDTAASFGAVVPLIVGLALPAAALLALAPRLAAVPASAFALITVAATGLAMRLWWFGTTPPLEDDYYRYLWDGALVAHGLDPYAYAPQTFMGEILPVDAYGALARGAGAVLHGINFPDLRTIYPSFAQAAFALAHLIAPFSEDGLRIVFLGSELATFAMILVALRSLGHSQMWSILYWWNPLPAAMLIGLVHVDALLPPLVLGFALALWRGWPLLALGLAGLGAGVKVWPLLLIPLALWGSRREPGRLLASGSVLACVLVASLGPVLLSTRVSGSGFAAYASGWSNNNGFYAWTTHIVSWATGSLDSGVWVRPAVGLAAAGVAVAMAVRGEPTLRSILGRVLVITAAIFYLSPAQFPWYAVWFLPLAAVCRCWPLLLASATLPFYYLFFPLWPDRYGVWFFYGAAFIHSVPVLAWLLWASIRRRVLITSPAENLP